LIPLYSRSARRAIAKIASYGIAALGTPVPAGFLHGPPGNSFRGGNYSATITDQNRVTFLNRKKRDKKQAQVMIDPLQPGLSQSTGGANPLSLTHDNSLGLNSANKKEHFSPALKNFKRIYITFFWGWLRFQLRQLKT
jgi:hypothetical protein